MLLCSCSLTITLFPPILLYLLPILAYQEGTKAGEKFQIQHEDRFFEVVCPEGTVPGQTINVIAPKTKFESLQTLVDASVKKGLDVAKELDEKYDVVNKATALKGKVETTVKDYAEKYDLSSWKIVDFGKDLLEKGVTKGKELDDKYKVVEYLKGVMDRVVAYAVEIDGKYAITTIASRLVVDTANKVLGATAPKLLSAAPPASAASAATAE